MTCIHRTSRGLLGLVLGAAIGAACQDPAGTCEGEIDVACADGRCWCGAGPRKDESCVLEGDLTDPGNCETLCCGTPRAPHGPPSILRGTR